MAIAKHFSLHPFFGLVDIIPAYSSIAFSFNLYAIHRQVNAGTTVFNWVQQHVEAHLPNISTIEDDTPEPIEIPVCYDPALSNDLAAISLATGLTQADIISLHTAPNYYVYMLGFVPGFAYMGEVNTVLELPRKNRPEKVNAGAVAIAGKQTGIYPSHSFGGWHVLGHTPVKMFIMRNEHPCYLKAGEEVKFYPITLAEYLQMEPYRQPNTPDS